MKCQTRQHVIFGKSSHGQVGGTVEYTKCILEVFITSTVDIKTFFCQIRDEKHTHKNLPNITEAQKQALNRYSRNKYS